jgi:hypothetical protein
LRSSEALLGEGEADYVDVEATLMLMIVLEVAPRESRPKGAEIGNSSLHELKFIDGRAASSEPTVGIVNS